MPTKQKERGLLLRRARRILDVTQERLAARVGVSQAQIARFEAGTATPTPGQAKRLAKALHIAMEVLR
ncbi:MAG: helix-turn-helix domain-containing protein [Elusimicrobia bacterium]|nr:helix-turn-helix domain-containing protein [Elusimicrobiota bacterium]